MQRWRQIGHLSQLETRKRLAQIILNNYYEKRMQFSIRDARWQESDDCCSSFPKKPAWLGSGSARGIGFAWWFSSENKANEWSIQRSQELPRSIQLVSKKRSLSKYVSSHSHWHWRCNISWRIPSEWINYTCIGVKNDVRLWLFVSHFR